MGDDHLPFPTILYNMITNESKRGAASPIRWVCNGETFVVDGSVQPEVNNILKKYFNRKCFHFGLTGRDIGRNLGYFAIPWNLTCSHTLPILQ